MKIIKDLDELKELCIGEGLEVRLLLNYGLFSRKMIAYDGELWSVKNYADDTEQKLTDKELETETNIVKGIQKHALVYEGGDED